MTHIHKTIGALLLPIAVLISDYALAENQDCLNGYEFLKSQRKGDGIALPHTGLEMNSQYDTHQVCYRGKDVTQWAAGLGMEITSGSNGFFKNGTVAIVTAHERLEDGRGYWAGDYKAALILLRVDEETGELKRTMLATQKQDNDPTKTIEDFHLAGYDEFNKVVYFETPAFATASAIYSFPVFPVLQGEKPVLKYFGPGRIDLVMFDLGTSNASRNIGNVLVWRDEIFPDRGRDEVLYLINSAGKQICKVDSTDPGYRFNPVCINH
ncbi:MULTISPECIES: hypothetical protein [unclassified Pseudomonas]|uniref:hypothetical protein n=1 Tax=unclassified Pseudomonas TaxID=196821 RepID=UPI0021D855FE|nr:hypothetical protein [Pseudomonas sp. YeP6b]UXZ22295.1 hypothetical protein KZH41_28195 [Pseudomonas sp. YeP6b]